MNLPDKSEIIEWGCLISLVLVLGFALVLVTLVLAGT